MGNITDYVNEFRSINFKEKPFSDVDSLVLSQISYYNFAESAFAQKEFSISLAELLQSDFGPIVNATTTMHEDDALFGEALSESGRHGSLRGSNYIEVMDEQAEKQFSAITFEIQSGEYVIVFRGTDNSVTGWKEDMAMSYEESIPAQKDALAYAMNIMDHFEGNFYLSGHSKGGNLSVYTGIRLPWKYRKRLLGIYDHDGPGFVDSVYVGEAYWKVRPLIRKSVPRSSVIGTMWQADDNYKVVLSDAKLLIQHDPFTWIIHEGKFAEAKEVDAFSRYTKVALERWVDTLSREERKQIVGTVFDVIYRAGIGSFEELTEDTLPNVLRLLAEVAEMEAGERSQVLGAVRQLFLVSRKEIPMTVKAEGAAKVEEQTEKVKAKLLTVKEELDKIAQNNVERYEYLRDNLQMKALETKVKAGEAKKSLEEIWKK